MKPSNPNFIKIGFTLLDIAETDIDPDFKAPTAAPEWNDEVLVDGSVKYVNKDKLRQMAGGDRPIADGHVMIWIDDLIASSLNPKKGDRITSIAGQETDYMIIEIKPLVHVAGVPQVKIFEFEKRTTQ